MLVVVDGFRLTQQLGKSLCSFWGLIEDFLWCSEEVMFNFV